jgi:hypothetical protein
MKMLRILGPELRQIVDLRKTQVPSLMILGGLGISPQPIKAAPDVRLNVERAGVRGGWFHKFQ